MGYFKHCNVEHITQLWNRLFLADSGIGGEACSGIGFHSEQRRWGHPRASSGPCACILHRDPEAPMKCESSLLFPVNTGSSLHLGAPIWAPNALQAKELRQRTRINMFNKYWAMSVMCLKDLHFRKVAQSEGKSVTLGLFGKSAPLC